MPTMMRPGETAIGFRSDRTLTNKKRNTIVSHALVSASRDSCPAQLYSLVPGITIGTRGLPAAPGRRQGGLLFSGTGLRRTCCASAAFLASMYSQRRREEAVPFATGRGGLPVEDAIEGRRGTEYRQSADRHSARKPLDRQLAPPRPGQDRSQCTRQFFPGWVPPKLGHVRPATAAAATCWAMS